ncbi:conjugal transfer protein [Weissella coleopterorum]|uniref:Conjugal transfer protein n=2 Tax=Weissella coleopterorum TaxID=2714949 RepID=A0A6G8B260_9LACO|nr:conjugal transfer protein [Weissella coleopterorum]
MMIFLVALFVYFGYVLLLANSAVHNNHALKHQITVLNTKLEKASQGTTSYNPIVGQYLAGFLTTYYTFNTSENDTRTQELQKYFASNLHVSNSVRMTDQTFKSGKLQGIFLIDGVKTAQYDIVVNSDNKDVNMTVNVPYSQKNAQLTVVGFPYVANPIDSLGHVDKARLQQNQKQLNDEDIKARVTTFTNRFIKKYVSSSTKDMSMMMKDPVGLDGTVTLENVDNVNVSGSTEKPVVTADITVNVKDTNIKQVQTVRLELEKQASTYFVIKLVQA